jgi:hypothetical protein
MAKKNDVFSYRFDQPPDNAPVEIGGASHLLPNSRVVHADVTCSDALPGGCLCVLEPAPIAEPALCAPGMRRARAVYDSRVGQLRAQLGPEPHRLCVHSCPLTAARDNMTT